MREFNYLPHKDATTLRNCVENCEMPRSKAAMSGTVYPNSRACPFTEVTIFPCDHMSICRQISEALREESLSPSLIHFFTVTFSWNSVGVCIKYCSQGDLSPKLWKGGILFVCLVIWLVGWFWQSCGTFQETPSIKVWWVISEVCCFLVIYVPLGNANKPVGS